MIKKSKFWPLDYEPEDEIYENLSWDLPGLRRTRRRRARQVLVNEKKGAARN